MERNFSTCMGDNSPIITERLTTDCGAPVSHVQLACCLSHFALPWGDKELRVYSILHPEQEPLQLCGHHQSISALAFGNGSPLLLCSASEDYVIAWDIQHCYCRAKQGLIAPGIVIGRLLGNVSYLAMCPADMRAAVCSGNKIHILHTKEEEVLALLLGHLGTVTAAEFCPWAKDHLVSTSEDRTFRVWDVNKEQTVFMSSVLSAFPLLSLHLCEDNKQLITGSADGQVWCFNLLDEERCRIVMKLDLAKAERRYHRRLKSPNASNSLVDDAVESTKPILKISSHCQAPGQACRPESDGICFWIGSSDGLYLIDLSTSELSSAVHLTETPVGVAGSWAIVEDESKVICLVASLFDSTVSLLDVQLPVKEGSQINSAQSLLSVFPSVPPMTKSVLKAELVKKNVPKCSQKTGKAVNMKSHPLVFHSRVKSSGYSMSPRGAMFTPKTNCQKKIIGPQQTGNKKRCPFTEYPASINAPNLPHTQVCTAERPTPVTCLQYSGDGKHILCGLGDRTALLYKASLTGTPAVYTGHDRAITAVGWSHNRQWLLTAADDHTLRVWPFGPTEPALLLGSEQFSKPIKCAQFYYLDKYLLVASGSALHLYLYHLDMDRDEIKRYRQRSTSRLAGRFQTSTGTDITCASAINEFFSYLVLTCGGDRSVEVFDMNAGRIAARLGDAHSRAIHHIEQNKGSIFTTQTPSSYNLFLTCAMTDGVKLWDLRSLRCVRRFESHKNQCQHCTAAFSPCGRYIATGSEDNSAYVYDIDRSSYLHKLPRQTETVLSVAFNPAKPELLTGTLDGKLQLFRTSDGMSVG